MRAFTAGLIGAAALAAGLLLVRGVRDEDRLEGVREMIPAGETQPATISLERIRAQGY